MNHFPVTMTVGSNKLKCYSEAITFSVLWPLLGRVVCRVTGSLMDALSALSRDTGLVYVRLVQGLEVGEGQ